MRSLIRLLMSLGLVIAIAGCSQSPSSSAPSATGGAKKLIGLSLDTLKEARWQTDRDLFIAKCKELGCEVLVQSANSDDVQQLKDVDQLITRGCAAIVIVPHNGDAMAKAVANAKDAKIPVIAYDRLIKNADIDLYVTFDNVAVGEAQAKYLTEKLGSKGKIVRIYGAKTDNNASMFKEGQDKVLKPLIDSGAITVLHEDWADDWKPEVAKKIMNAAITKSGKGKDYDADGVLASNDGTAGGAIQALTEEGLAGKIIVTGQDADLVACQRIALGTQAMTIYKPIKNLATKAAELAVALADKKPVEATAKLNNGKLDVPSVFLPIVTVTKDNIVGSVVKDGFHTYDEIYKDVPEGQRPPKS